MDPRGQPVEEEAVRPQVTVASGRGRGRGRRERGPEEGGGRKHPLGLDSRNDDVDSPVNAQKLPFFFPKRPIVKRKSHVLNRGYRWCQKRLNYFQIANMNVIVMY